MNISIYVDMDNTLCDFNDSYTKIKEEDPHIKYPQSIPNFFRDLKPIEGAVETFKYLWSLDNIDVYILTAPSIKNKLCYTEKALWIYNHFGEDVLNNLIISAHKHLNKGDYLIDDCDSGKGQDKFEGELILFGSKEFKNWQEVRHYLDQKINTR